jgi:hypothetical protein
MEKILAFDAVAVRKAVREGLAADSILALLSENGIVFDEAIGPVNVLKEEAIKYRYFKDMDGKKHVLLGKDAQPELVTISNGGIPHYLTNYFDPKTIEVLVSPMKATQIVGDEVRKGDWTTTEATFVTVERTGETSGYNDFNNNGMAQPNLGFPTRQSFYFQTMGVWGERQLDMAGLARVNYANEVQASMNLALAKFTNKSYFFGISGLKLYGLLNDPSLPASISPTAQWTLAATSPESIYNDVVRMYQQIQLQTGGTVEMDAPMTLAISNFVNPALDKANTYGVTARKLIRENFPNLTLQTAPEYSTSTGELAQLVVKSIDGQRTAETAFNEKMRAHSVIPSHSSWSQKRSSGTFGTVIYLPMAIASMLGI